MSKLNLGPVGVTVSVSDTYLDEAAELEQQGYSAIWLPGGQIDELGRLGQLIQATRAVPVGSSIIPVDVYRPDQVTAVYGQLEARAPGRFVAGLGGPQQQPRPLQVLTDYLDQLDRAQPPVPPTRRLLAALGPHKLELARDRSAGAIMLLVTPGYLAAARQLLGEGRSLVVELMLVADTDAARARQTARRPLQFLSGLRGYRASFSRMGFTDADIAGLADPLVDQLVAWGDADAIGGRIGQYLRAGADHVILHVLSEDGQPSPIEAARQLAGRLPTVPAW